MASKMSIAIRKAWRLGKYANRDTSRSGRPKGVKDVRPRKFTARGLKAKKKSGVKLHKLMVSRGTIGWPKGVPHTKKHNLKNSFGVCKAIAEGCFTPGENMRKFIKDADGTELYWRTRGHRGVRGSFYSKKNRKVMYYDSSWELARMETLERDRCVLEYRRQPVQIPYSLNGKAHYYRPDLLVLYRTGQHVLEEIKPSAMLDRPEVKAKFQAARAFCRTAKLQFKVLCSLEACLEY